MQIHIGRSGQQLGAFSLQEIRDGLATGRFLSNDLAWHEGLNDWMPLEALPILQSAPPPTPATPPVPASSAPVAAAPAPAYARPAAGSASLPPAPQRTNPLAGWSLGLGLGSLFCIFSAIPAVICGHMAISRINRSGGREGGRGMAVAGLVIGYLMIAAIPVLLSLAIPTFNIVQQKALEAKSMANARQVVLSCKMWASDHGGKYPPDLETLVQDGVITDDSILRCPILKDDTQIGYRYYGAGLTDSDPGDKAVLIGKAANRKGERVVAFNNSSVEMKVIPDNLPEAK